MKLVLLLASALALATAARAADPPPLSVYAADADIDGADISPDGKHVAYVGRYNGKRAALMLDASGVVTPVIGQGQSEIGMVEWIDDQHLLVFASAMIRGNDSLPKQKLTQGIIYNLITKKTVVALDNTPETLPVLAGPGPYATSGQKYQGRPTLFIRGVRNGPSFDFYRVDLDTGRGTVADTGSFEAANWVVAGDGRLIAKSTFDPPKRLWTLYRYDGGWSTIRRETTSSPPYLISIGRSQDTVLTLAGEGLTEVSLKNGEPLVGALGLGAASSPIYDPASGRLIGVEVSGEFPTYTFYDPRLQAAWAKVVRAFNGRSVRLVAQDAQATQLIVDVESGTDAGAFYWVDLTTGQANIVEKKREALADAQVGPVRRIDYRASDGLALSGYLTLPPGRPRKGLPLIVLAHGPGERATFGFVPFAQMLASRGYAVFQINQRGSTGVSPALEAAGAGQLGRAMQTDISEGVTELARQGVVDPKRVCIAGSEFGGHAALLGVTIQSGIYRCAIAINAVSDLPLRLELPDTDLRGGRWEEIQRRRLWAGASRPRDPAVLAVSPLAQASRASAPILLINGAEDEYIPLSDTVKMNAALKAAGRPAELTVIKEIPHEPTGPAHRERIYDAVLKFLSRENPATV